MPAHYTPEALKFLRGLARHNDRAWFDPRKPLYERTLKAPTLALIEEVNHALLRFAPDHIRSAGKIMMRIYRDTRFDASRGTEPRPYKTQVAAWWGYNGPGPKVAKTSGAGFYFHLSAKEVTIAAGCYMPAADQLLAIRRHLVTHHAELRRHLANPRLRSAMHEFEGARLTRPPRGFPPDTPGLDLILCRQWGVSAQLPPEAALTPSFAREIASRFKLASPIVHLLNAAIVGAPGGHEP
ncbi:MAG: DUF2461 domain-containing protein [Acidobacteriota bacterium]|nr:DUF2461 domain-containing protein [Acidobacteriota bacterium]